MGQIHNTGTLKEIAEVSNSQSGYDSLPSKTSEAVVYTMEVNPKLLRRVNINKNAAAVNATSATIYTTPSDKDFYLTNASMSVIKDATATSAGSSINVTIDGVNGSVIGIRGLTLTAQADSVAMSFPVPIKIDRNTIINITNSTNVANVSAQGIIQGYTVESQGR